MLKVVIAVARFTVLEAARTRVPWIVLGVIVGGLALAEIAAGLALTDSHAYRLAGYAAWTRLVLVATVTLLVATSVAREFEAGLLDLSLSRPLSRPQWYLGRLCGFAAIACAIALAAAAPLWLTAAPAAALGWGLSLAAELVLVAAASLCASVALGQLTASVLAVAAFYLLSRSMAAIVLMSHGPLLDATAGSTAAIAQAVAAIALVLPPLDRFTVTAWLQDSSTPVAGLAAIAVHTALYVLLLTAVGLFDFARRDL